MSLVLINFIDKFVNQSYYLVTEFIILLYYCIIKKIHFMKTKFLTLMLFLCGVICSIPSEGKSFPFKTAKEFFDYAKSSGQKITFHYTDSLRQIYVFQISTAEEKILIYPSENKNDALQAIYFLPQRGRSYYLNFYYPVDSLNVLPADKYVIRMNLFGGKIYLNDVLQKEWNWK